MECSWRWLVLGRGPTQITPIKNDDVFQVTNLFAPFKCVRNMISFALSSTLVWPRFFHHCLVTKKYPQSNTATNPTNHTTLEIQHGTLKKDKKSPNGKGTPSSKPNYTMVKVDGATPTRWLSHLLSRWYTCFGFHVNLQYHFCQPAHVPGTWVELCYEKPPNWLHPKSPWYIAVNVCCCFTRSFWVRFEWEKFFGFLGILVAAKRLVGFWKFELGLLQVHPPLL